VAKSVHIRAQVRTNEKHGNCRTQFLGDFAVCQSIKKMTRLVAVDALEKRVEAAKLAPAANMVSMIPSEMILIVSRRLQGGDWRETKWLGLGLRYQVSYSTRFGLRDNSRRVMLSPCTQPRSPSRRVLALSP